MGQQSITFGFVNFQEIDIIWPYINLVKAAQDKLPNYRLFMSIPFKTLAWITWIFHCFKDISTHESKLCKYNHTIFQDLFACIGDLYSFISCWL